MFFGSSFTKKRPTTEEEGSDGKEFPSSPKMPEGNEEDWFLLKGNGQVFAVPDSSQPSAVDPSFEVVGAENEDCKVAKEETSLPNTRVRPNGKDCCDQVFHSMENMVDRACNGRLTTNEKWRAIFVLLLCSVISKRTFFYSREEEEMQIPVPIVLVEDKPSPVYEAFVMIPPLQRDHEVQKEDKPAAKPNIVGMKSYQTPLRPTIKDDDTVIESSEAVEAPREKPMGPANADKTFYGAGSQYRRPVKPKAESEFRGMKDGGSHESTVGSIHLETSDSNAASSSSFVDPRPRQSPAHSPFHHRDQEGADQHDDIVLSLSKRIAELQTKNEQYREKLTDMAIESSTWRSRVVSCDQELDQVKKDNEALLMAAKQNERSTKSSFSTSMIPIPTVLTEAWKNHYYGKKSKQPMASSTGVPAIDSSSAKNATDNIPYTTNGVGRHVDDRALRPVGPTSLIPSPA